MAELIIIKTENSQELKSFLQKKRIDYEIYPYDAKRVRREKWLKDIKLANQDEKRNKEIAEWDQIQAEDDAEKLTNEDEWNFS
ncbi:MAG: hypothetical protein I3274_08205 [Candidatus Moeniiplasma glomeromycotorum]|nr:hypothetical protein [Candidatus Moeniiplasma glomeromycotorum]MCE8167782.1 hypothetical protein [Candidatus Moeniiplasma glomeromycotorum]